MLEKHITINGIYFYSAIKNCINAESTIVFMDLAVAKEVVSYIFSEMFSVSQGSIM